MEAQSMNNPRLGFVLSALGAFGVLVLVAGFVPDVSGPEIRRPYTESAVQSGATSAVTRPLSHIVWNMRGELTGSGPSPRQALLPARPALLELKDGMVALRTVSGASPLLSEPGGAFLRPLLEAPAVRQESRKTKASRARADAPAGPLAAVLGEPLDFQGLPIRWSSGEKLACGFSPNVRERVDKLLAGWREVAGLPVSLRQRVERYRPTVEKYAERYGLDPGLVYAIIYTESSFNPTLISSRSAHGLMQVVPSTAGGEVHAWFGRSGIPDAEVLLHPETNIRYGTAYFHLLLTRHLKAIVDPLSREYCAIASYNSGSWGMLKAFGATEAEAFAAINAMTPDEVRAHLLQKLPSRETRSFVRKVLDSRARFTAML